MRIYLFKKMQDSVIVSTGTQGVQNLANKPPNQPKVQQNGGEPFVMGCHLSWVHIVLPHVTHVQVQGAGLLWGEMMKNLI